MLETSLKGTHSAAMPHEVATLEQAVVQKISDQQTHTDQQFIKLAATHSQ